MTHTRRHTHSHPHTHTHLHTTHTQIHTHISTHTSTHTHLHTTHTHTRGNSPYIHLVYTPHPIAYLPPLPRQVVGVKCSSSRACDLTHMLVGAALVWPPGAGMPVLQQGEQAAMSLVAEQLVRVFVGCVCVCLCVCVCVCVWIWVWVWVWVQL